MQGKCRLPSDDTLLCITSWQLCDGYKLEVMCTLSDCVTNRFFPRHNKTIYGEGGLHELISYCPTCYSNCNQLLTVASFYVIFILFSLLASFKPCWVHPTEEWWAGNRKCDVCNAFVVISGGGAVTSWSVWSTPNQVVWLSPGWEHCIVILSKTLNSHSASLHPGV